MGVLVGVKVGTAAEGMINDADVWVGEVVVSAGVGIKVRYGAILAGGKNPFEFDAPVPPLSDKGTEVIVVDAGGSINAMAKSIWMRPAPEYRSQPEGPISKAVDSMAFRTWLALFVKEKRIEASPLTKGADMDVPLSVKYPPGHRL